MVSSSPSFLAARRQTTSLADSSIYEAIGMLERGKLMVSDYFDAVEDDED